jgi:hypothetical protein
LEILDTDTESHIRGFDQDDAEHIEHDFNHYGSPYNLQTNEDDPKFLKSIWENSASLKEFVSLKRLSFDVNFLLYFAQGISGASDEMRGKATVADCLPKTLECVYVRGYKKSGNKEHDEQMDLLNDFF